MSAPQLEALLAPLADARLDVRRAIAARVAQLGDLAFGAIVGELAAQRTANSGMIRGAIRAVAPPGDPHARSKDLVEALLASGARDPGAIAALRVACLARALAHIGTTPAVRELVLVASDAGGALRPEITRVLTELGDRSTAALIEAQRSPTPETRVWAESVLDGQNKRMPGDAVQTNDSRVLADVLRAYGTVRDLDAVPTVLSFANSERTAVRVAARTALFAYGHDATWKLKEAYTQITARPPADDWSPKMLATALFDAYDRVRLKDAYALLDDGLAKARAGDLDGAANEFDQLLARQPMLDRRNEMVATYVRVAASRARSDTYAAESYLRKAQRLDSDAHSHAPELESALLVAEGFALRARGIDEPALFRRAAEIDPTNVAAEDQIARDDATIDAHERALRGWTGGFAAGLAILGVGLFLVAKRCPKREPPSEGAA